MRLAAEPLAVACIAYDGLSLFEAGIASEVFGVERPEFDGALYRFRMAKASRVSCDPMVGFRSRRKAACDC